MPFKFKELEIPVENIRSGEYMKWIERNYTIRGNV